MISYRIWKEEFVVFANAHPDIVLAQINMNEDVTKLYNHVKTSDAQ